MLIKSFIIEIGIFILALILTVLGQPSVIDTTIELVLGVERAGYPTAISPLIILAMKIFARFLLIEIPVRIFVRFVRRS